MDDFYILFLDFIKSFVPALVIKYQLDNTILMFYVPLIVLMTYIFKNLSFINLPFFNESQITIKHTISNKTPYNQVRRNFYFAVMHFIKNEKKNSGGEFIIPDASSMLNKNYYKEDASSKVVSMQLALVSNKKIVIDYNNIKLYISGKYNENGDGINLYLYISGPNITIIRDFINFCHDEYEKQTDELLNSGNNVYVISSDFNTVDWKLNKNNLGKNFNNLFINSTLKQDLINDIDNFINNKKKYRELGSPYKRGYLLYGPPGTGKSSTYYAIAQRLNFNIYKLSVDGLSTKDIKKLIINIPRNSILVIDDIDRIPLKKNPSIENKENKEKKENNNEDDDSDVLGKLFGTKPSSNSNDLDMQLLLSILDGYDYLDSCLVILTTNHINKLDDALIRSGRIDFKMEISYVDYDIVNDIFNNSYKCKKELLDFGINKDSFNNKKITTADIIQKIVLQNNDYENAIEKFKLFLLD